MPIKRQGQEIVMRSRPTKGDKKDIRQEMHLTRAPRMEGAVKEAMMQPVRKKRRAAAKTAPKRKPQGYTDGERKDYQLKSKR